MSPNKKDTPRKAPYFQLPDSTGIFYTLNTSAPLWNLVYFYPKDDTPGCTKEACAFRDLSIQYRQAGIQVIGISRDSQESHKAFANKYHLTFPLLSDPDTTTIRAYGAWGQKKFMGKTFEGVIRTSFLIDPKGYIRKEYPKVNVMTHAEDILRDFRNLASV